MDNLDAVIGTLTVAQREWIVPLQERVKTLEAELAALKAGPGDEKVREALAVADKDDRPWMPATVLAQWGRSLQARLAYCEKDASHMSLHIDGCEEEELKAQVQALQARLALDAEAMEQARATLVGNGEGFDKYPSTIRLLDAALSRRTSSLANHPDGAGEEKA